MNEEMSSVAAIFMIFVNFFVAIYSVCHLCIFEVGNFRILEIH